MKSMKSTRKVWLVWRRVGEGEWRPVDVKQDAASAEAAVRALRASSPEAAHAASVAVANLPRG